MRPASLIPLFLVVSMSVSPDRHAATVGFGVERLDASMSDVVDALVVYRDGTEREQGEARQFLADEGPELVPVLFRILAGDVAPALRNQNGPLLTREGSLLLRDVMREWPAEEVSKSIFDSVGRAASLDDQMLAIELVGEFGEADALVALVELVAEMQAEHRYHPMVTRLLGEALEKMLRRDPEGYAVLQGRVNKLDPSVWSGLALALRELGDGNGFALLKSLSGRAGDLDVDVLRAMSAMAPWAQARTSGECVEFVRFHLSATDADTRRQAVLTIGTLRDSASVAELIGMVNEADPRIARAAHWALREMSGLRWGADEERWSLWWYGQERWMETRVPDLLSTMTSADTDAAAAVRALREISVHPIFARELSRAIAPLLRHPDENVALATAKTLRLLDDRELVEPWIEALADEREKLRRFAHRQLAAWTGADLAADAAVWRSWLGR